MSHSEGSGAVYQCGDLDLGPICVWRGHKYVWKVVPSDWNRDLQNSLVIRILLNTDPHNTLPWARHRNAALLCVCARVCVWVWKRRQGCSQWKCDVTRKRVPARRAVSRQSVLSCAQECLDSCCISQVGATAILTPSLNHSTPLKSLDYAFILSL